MFSIQSYHHGKSARSGCRCSVTAAAVPQAILYIPCSLCVPLTILSGAGWRWKHLCLPEDTIHGQGRNAPFPGITRCICAIKLKPALQWSGADWPWPTKTKDNPQGIWGKCTTNETDVATKSQLTKALTVPMSPTATTQMCLF